MIIMIEPGKITLELILGNPLYYMAWIYLAPLILAALAAYFADRAADEKLKAITGDPNMYEFENIRDPIVWGIFACIVTVFPLTETLDAVGSWPTVWASAILAGLTSRAILMKLAGAFLTKVTEVKG